MIFVDTNVFMYAVGRLVIDAGVDVWPLEAEDVYLARQLGQRFPALSARDLCCVASCQRRGVRSMRTFDRRLAQAFGGEALT